MNAKSTNRLPVRVWRFGIGGMLLAAGALIGKHGIAASTVIANPGPQTPIQTQDQQNQTNEMTVFPTAAQAQNQAQAAENPLPQFLQYGPVQLHPHLAYSFLYGNGIQSAPGDHQNTAIQQLSPGLTLDFGRHWVLDYTPTLRFYSNDKFQDGVDHAVTLNGGFDYDDWKFGVSHSSQFTSDPLVETGSQTDQQAHLTSLSASHPFTSKVSGDFSLSQSITLVSGLEDSYDWSTMDWVNYQFRPRFNVGIGAGGGYVLIEGNNALSTGSSDQTYEQLQARANWRATDKISFQINGGAEDRQFSTAGAGSSLNPIFGASIQYQPFKVTQVSLSANRTISSSDYYLAAQETEVTVVSLDVNQRVLRKFNLDLGVAYTKTDYSTPSGVAATGANRSDDQISFNARLSHPFFKRGTWSVFYQYGDNTSSQPGFSFQSNQTGFEVSYSF